MSCLDICHSTANAIDNQGIFVQNGAALFIVCPERVTQQIVFARIFAGDYMILTNCSRSGGELYAIVRSPLSECATVAPERLKAVPRTKKPRP